MSGFLSFPQALFPNGFGGASPIIAQMSRFMGSHDWRNQATCDLDNLSCRKRMTRRARRPSQSLLRQIVGEIKVEMYSLLSTSPNN
jgi:hypothetical protein